MQLTIHNDERPWSWEQSTDKAEIGIANFPWAAHQLRAVFADHRMIAVLGCMDIIAAPGAEHALEKTHGRLAEYIQDLGNSIPDCWMGAKHVIQNLAHIAKEPKSDALAGIFNGTVLCIASGPSNAKWLPLVRDLQHSCVIVCADSMWKGLRAAGIDPHFVCVLERDPLLASLVPPDPTSRATLVVPALAYPKTVDGWEGRRVWWWQTYADLYRWIAPDIPQEPTGRSAGSMAVALSVLLGSPRVYLIGHDLCRGDDGSSHSAHVDTLASTNHTLASGRHEPLHSELIVDGKRTCPFWNLVRGDIESLALDNPGKLWRLGSEGLDIPEVTRVHGIFPDGQWSINLNGLRIAPSRSPIEIKSMLQQDISSWTNHAPKVKAAADIPTMESVREATRLIDPAMWGNPELTGLYKYVLGPAYRAASLRAFIRYQEPWAHRAGFRILLRAIPATLQMMEAEC